MSSLYNLPPELDISKDETFSKDRLDQAFAYIVQRLLVLDSFRPSWEEQLNLFQSIGLTRLDDALRPVYEDLVSITQLGVMFTATSRTPSTLGSGLKTFTIADADKVRFAAAGYLSVQDVSMPEHTMFGLLQSYDRTSGHLSILIDQFVGDEGASSSNWRISAAASPNVLTTAHQVGAYTQQEVDATVAVLNTAISSLTAGKASKASPAFTGVPTAPTVLNAGATGDQIATLGFVQAVAAQIDAGLRANAPASLNTLSKIAQALGNDPNLAATMTAALLSKLSVTGPMTLSDSQKAQGRANINAQESLGYRPVVMGGPGTGPPSVAIGWGNNGHLRGSVDGSDIGEIWTDQGMWKNYNDTGFHQFPGGLMIQWGNVILQLDSSGESYVPFPSWFPSGKLFSLQVSNADIKATSGVVATWNQDRTGFFVKFSGSTTGAARLHFLAVGL